MYVRQFGVVFGILFLIQSHPATADHASVGLGVGTASPISTETAVTLPKGKWAVGVRSEYIKLNSFSAGKLQQLHGEDEEGDFHSVGSLWSNSLGATYGVTDNLMVGLRMPFIHRNDIKEPEHGHGGDEEHHDEEEHDEVPEIINLGDVEGIGDMTLFGEYRFFHRNKTYLAALFGVKMPTGKTHRKSDQGELLELELQPGSGSWDGLMGLAFTQGFGPMAFNASVLYTLVTEGDHHTDLGDVVSYNAALSYRIYGALQEYYAPPKFSVDLIAEVNGEWREKEKTRGEYNDNSGGNLVYISPGVRLGIANFVNLGFSFGVPVVKDTNGDQVEPDYRMVGTASVFW
ncbi:MAG: transporter [Gammaproteobacteria bacterium]